MQNYVANSLAIKLGYNMLRVKTRTEMKTNYPQKLEKFGLMFGCS